MTFVPFIGFAAIALLAIGFATFALWRGKTKGWALLGGAIALFLLGVGGGTYWMTGRPGLALRAAQGLHTREVNGLIPYLIARVRQEPDDLRAWMYLGGAYMSANDPGDAAKAYGRAVTVARLQKSESADLDDAYGEAVVSESGGAVNDEAAGAFAAALAIDPRNVAGRFFLGQARAEHGDRASALMLWQELLADTPTTAPLHQTLVDRIALLTAQAGNGAAPDPRMMVAGLAARLKADPHDADGWRRLIRAYTVLGQPDAAKAALVTARQTFAGDKAVLAALDGDAKDLKLD